MGAATAAATRVRSSRRRTISSHIPGPAKALIVVLVTLLSLWLYGSTKVVLSLHNNSENGNDSTNNSNNSPLEQALQQNTDLTMHDNHIHELSRAMVAQPSKGGGSGSVTIVDCNITTDVRGNLGPPSVLLNSNGTDWIKDRWQAASDMHGTNIKGEHWVQLTWSRHSSHPTAKSQNTTVPQKVVVQHMVLDWEAAYASDYDIQVQTIYGDWETDLAAPNPSLIAVTESGQSPGVKTKTPLHVIHTIRLPMETIPTNALRIRIRKSATGWGVSLWSVQVFGYYVQDDV